MWRRVAALAAVLLVASAILSILREPISQPEIRWLVDPSKGAIKLHSLEHLTVARDASNRAALPVSLNPGSARRASRVATSVHWNTELSGVAHPVASNVVFAGTVAWRAKSHPPDLDMFSPTLRAQLAAQKGRLRRTTAALAIKSYGQANDTTACLDGCSGRGRCDQLTGQCLCRHGYKGSSCKQSVPQLCNDPRQTCSDGRTCHEWTRFVSRCSGECDLTSNRCLCGPRAAYPDRHMFMCEWRGIERLTHWRSPGWAHFVVVEPCALATALLHCRVTRHQAVSHSAPPCHAMPCRALPCPAVPCRACRAMPCVPCDAMPCHAMPYHALPCLAVPCRALPCLAMPWGRSLAQADSPLTPRAHRSFLVEPEHHPSVV